MIQAHQFAVERHMSRVHRRISLEDWQLIESLIRRDWSPEQISLWLKKYKKIRVSHEWIYQYILKDKSQAGDLYTHLRLRKKRKKRYGGHNRRGIILNRVLIEKRPAVVDQRLRIGDWEIDTIIGAHHQGVLLSGRTQILIMPYRPIGEQICSRGRANYHQLTGFDQRKSAHRHF